MGNWEAGRARVAGRLGDRIPPEVLERATKSNVPKPDWYVGRLDSPDSKPSRDVGESVRRTLDPDRRTQLRQAAKSYKRGRATAPARGRIVSRVKALLLGWWRAVGGRRSAA